MGCRRYSAASQHEVLLDEDDFRSFLQALNLEMFCFFDNWVWQSWYSEINFVVLFQIHQYGLSVPVWSSSTCLGVNTQRFVGSCPHTGLTVLVGSVTFSCFSWERVSRSNLVRSRFPLLSTYGVRFFGCLCSPATSESKSHIHLSMQEIFDGDRDETYAIW